MKHWTDPFPLPVGKWEGGKVSYSAAYDTEVIPPEEELFGGRIGGGA
jgi:hypothetical protein